MNTRMVNITGLGYQGLTIDEYTQKLVEQNIQTVVDVRLTPILRKSGFSKTRLKNHLEKHGINYVHFRELGKPIGFMLYRDLHRLRRHGVFSCE